ncbi:YdeI/OmpD-associated family protein [Macrococcus capreoli]|uniref:YdeI/OmpD-associated family protein n=1 Tax=Macrococcus capreoli TaxID=2982690 RepID=UPI0021D5C307|nr:YdeI/OmpD-associated family protein [Macrococcus sp. TMW 2.2395]MCU7557170.1 YdeI/OmpD-associated family protein [Macrococcus sp. TMW 2.2395]
MTIFQKLKIEDKSVFVVNQPADYNVFSESHDHITGHHDIIFAFVVDIKGFKQTVQSCLASSSLNKGGLLFVAYPKKGNKKYDSYIHRDEIFPALKVMDDGYIQGTDYKFNRMVSMDEVYTVVGIKYVPERKVSKAASQCVADYADKVDDVIAILQQDVIPFFNSLTPGYKKDWARYLFSAKQEKTRLKRIEEMHHILREGYKTKELYRQHKK